MRRAVSLLSLVAALALAAGVSAQEHRGRDLDALLGRAVVVTRGEIVGVSDDGAELHPLAVFAQKSALTPVLRVRSEGERPMRPSIGDRGLYLLVPSVRTPGALSFLQEDGERWPVEPEADAAVDLFMRRLLAAPEPAAQVWLDGLGLPAPALVSHSARRLATLARRGALSSGDWEKLLAFLGSEKASDESRAGIVDALADALPSDRALSLLGRAREGSRLKSALLAAMAQRGVASTAKDRAKAAMGAAARDASPEVALAAAKGLAAIGDEAALPALERALESNDTAVRQGAVDAISKLARHHSRAARKRLFGLFGDADGLVRASARNAWADAYLNDPDRIHRSRPSAYLVFGALGLLLLVVLHSVVERRRA